MRTLHSEEKSALAEIPKTALKNVSRSWKSWISQITLTKKVMSPKQRKGSLTEKGGGLKTPLTSVYDYNTLFEKND